MKKHLLLMVITALVMLFMANIDKSFSGHHPILKNDVSPSLAFCIAAPGLPINPHRDENAPHFAASPTLNSQPPSYFFRLHYQALFSLKALFSTQDVEKYRLPVPGNIRSFFMALFRVIISPNAP